MRATYAALNETHGWDSFLPYPATVAAAHRQDRHEATSPSQASTTTSAVRPASAMRWSTASRRPPGLLASDETPLPAIRRILGELPPPTARHPQISWTETSLRRDLPMVAADWRRSFDGSSEEAEEA